MPYRIARVLLCAVLLTAPAIADEQVVVTATRLAGLSGGNVSVIGADQIAAQDPASIVDVLRELPSVFVQQQGGSVVSIFTRGAKPNFTLVLLDGVKANDPTNTRGGSYDFSTLDVADIDHIEMVRGPASAIYGSDAVGGVINIVSRHGGPTPTAGVTVEDGAYGFVRAQAHIGGPIGGAAGNLGVSYRDSGMAVDGSDVHGFNLDGALTLPRLAGTYISFTGRFNSSVATSFPDSSGGPQFATLRTLDHRDVDEAVLGAHAKRDITRDWAMSLDYGFYDRWSNATSPGVAPSLLTPSGIPANGDTARFTRHAITWTNRLDLGAVQAAIGADLQAEHGVDDGYLFFGANIPTHFALDRTLWAGFAEARWQVVRGFAVSASGRYDSAGGSDHFSPQLRADVTPFESTALQLSWGRAYKLPSFYALGNPIVGDPTLKPEDAQTLEGGITQKLGGATWKVQAYATNYRNLIDFQPGPVPRLVNLSTVHVRGVESEIDWRWKAFTITPRVSYTRARNTASGAQLRDVPQWLAGASLLWQPSMRFDASFDLSHVGSFTDNAVPTGDVTLGSHVRADMAAGYALTPHLKLKLGVDNLLNQQYDDAVGFREPGIMLRGGIAASL